MPTKSSTPTRPRLPKYLAEIDLTDPGSWREPIGGMFYSSYDILSSEMGPFDVPSVDEIIRYHPAFALASRDGFEIHVCWIRHKRNPFAQPELCYRYCNAFYEGFGGQEDFIAIPKSEIAKFTRKVRYVNAAIAEIRRARGEKRKPRAKRHGRLQLA